MTDERDYVWNRAIDNLVILFSLTLARSQLDRLPVGKRVRGLVKARFDKLIRIYKQPEAGI